MSPDKNKPIVVAGKKYGSIEEMPAEVRKLYQTQQVAMETYRDFSVDATTPRAAKVDAPPAQRMDMVKQPFLKRYMWPLIILAVIVLTIVIIFV